MKTRVEADTHSEYESVSRVAVPIARGAATELDVFSLCIERQIEETVIAGRQGSCRSSARTPFFVFDVTVVAGGCISETNT